MRLDGIQGGRERDYIDRSPTRTVKQREERDDL